MSLFGLDEDLEDIESELEKEKVKLGMLESEDRQKREKKRKKKKLKRVKKKRRKKQLEQSKIGSIASAASKAAKTADKALEKAAIDPDELEKAEKEMFGDG